MPCHALACLARIMKNRSVYVEPCKAVLVAVATVVVYVACHMILQARVTLDATQLMNGHDSSSLAWSSSFARMAGLRQIWFSDGNPPADTFEYALNARASVVLMTGSWFAAGAVQPHSLFGLVATLCAVTAATLLSLRLARRKRRLHGVAILAACLAMLGWWVTFPRDHGPGPPTSMLLSSDGCTPPWQFGVLLGVTLVVTCFSWLYAPVVVAECSRLCRRHPWLTISVATGSCAIFGWLGVYLVKYQHAFCDEVRAAVTKVLPIDLVLERDSLNTSVRLLPNMVAEMTWPDGDALLVTFAARDPAIAWRPIRPTAVFSGRYTASFAAAWSVRRNGVWSEPVSEFRIANPSSPTGIEDRFRIELSHDRVVALLATHGGTSLYDKPRSLLQSGVGILNPELGLHLRGLVVQKLGTLDGPIKIDPNTNPLLIPITPSTSPPVPGIVPTPGPSGTPAGLWQPWQCSPQGHTCRCTASGTYQDPGPPVVPYTVRVICSFCSATGTNNCTTPTTPGTPAPAPTPATPGTPVPYTGCSCKFQYMY